MKEKQKADCETIIIGGGISGLACGKTLYDAGKDFLLLSKDIGGRMRTSKSQEIDYGALYVTEDYLNVLKYVDKIEKIPIWKIFFLNDRGFYSILNLGVLLHLPQLIKICFIEWDFCRRLKKLHKLFHRQSQKEALKSNPVIESYVKMPATKFIKKHGIEFLHTNFFKQVVKGTTFTEIEELNAFYYLGSLIPLVRRSYTADFQHTAKHITEGWDEKIRETTVHNLSKTQHGTYEITTSHCTLGAHNVVLALPYHNARKLYPVPRSGPTIPVYVFHVVGEREEIYRNKKVVVFNPDQHDINALWRQHTGSDIIYTKNPNPDLSKYYKHHHTVRKIYWKAAFMISGSKWVDQKLDEGLYLASDYNIFGLEDSFITGIYAANQIIGKQK